MIAREGGVLTVYVEPVDVICSGSIRVRVDGTLLVRVTDGCRALEVQAPEVDAIYQELSAQRRRMGAPT